MTAAADPLDGFAAPTRDWFAGAFAEPTAAQSAAWAAIGAGEHTLVVAPTGSGKTLAAFLWSLDRLMVQAPPDEAHRCRVLYVSPLKALAADVERNLRSPLVGIRQAAQVAGLSLPDVTVGVRTGDTPPAERRAMATRPPDVLITTPESLFLVLTSAARSGLVGVRTVIVDEIHAVAGTKRGAHLAVSLERLDALLEAHGGPAQRVGLSATVEPAEVVARFLAGGRTPADGGRPVRVVRPAAVTRVEVEVAVPVPDLSDLASAPVRTGASGGAGASGDRPPQVPDLAGPTAGAPRRPSIWPHVEERVVDLVAAHRSTLVFANSRRGAERLTARLNEVWAQRAGAALPDHGSLHPAAVQAQSGVAVGLPADQPVIARAHHGSMSRAERTRTESELKAGRLPAVVATSSLELGIDMGAIDLVVLVGSPPSVASGLQRVGRAGHQVGAVSRGVVLPTFRGDLVPAAVIAERMRAGLLEPLHVPTSPLDVLAQQVVAMVAVDDWTVEELATVVRRAAPFAELGEASLRSVLDLLAGRYPAEDFAELRPRLVWDRTTGSLRGRPGALRLAVTSGGTIPDRGLYGVFLAGDAASSADVGPSDDDRAGQGAAVTAPPARHRGGRRVGELDEEMVYESRVGDTFTLGSSTWRIEQITPDRVLVTPAPGLPGRLPFWKGDSPGRPAALGRALGAWVRQVAALPPEAARRRLTDAGLDTWASDNLLAYLTEQVAATGRLPDDRTIVVERFRDELGDWRVVVHSPFGAKVHAPWALVIGARLRERYGVDAAVMHSDDGIVLRLPDAVSSGEGTWDTVSATWVQDDAPAELPDLLIEADEVADAVRAELGGSAMFAARFREAAARALLLPRRRPDRRQPLWQQRQRSAQLLAVAAHHPQFPILLEAARECLQDDFEVDALADLMRDVAARRVSVVEVTTAGPSPFAQSLLFGYTAQFLYDGDAPLAERRAAALSLDPDLLAELLGGATPVADLLEPAAVLQVEAELAGTAEGRRARHKEDVADVVRRHGPLTTAEVVARTLAERAEQVPGWLTELRDERRVLAVRLAGGLEHWAAIEDAGRLRDALGVALPVGVPVELTGVQPDPWGDLVRRHARTHGPFTSADVAARFGVTPSLVTEVLRRLVADGALVVGRLRPEVLGGTGEDHCDPGVLRALRRRSLALLRGQLEPVPAEALGVFLPQWQQVTTHELQLDGTGRRTAGGLRGIDGLARVVDQLAGFAVPASALESLVLPARVVDYSPAMLDELLVAGEVLWAGHGSLASRDGLVSLHPTTTADLTLPVRAELTGALGSALHGAVLAVLGRGGAWFADQVTTLVAAELDEPVAPSGTAVVDALWDLVWAGRVTNDGFGPLRARLGSGRGTAHPVRRGTPRGRPGRGMGLRLVRPGQERAGAAPGHPGAVRPDAGGRWSALPAPSLDPTERAHASAVLLLDRHGVLTRAVAGVEGVSGSFGQVYRVLAALEQAGSVRRGYVVEHLGGSQFALPGAVDLVREAAAVSARALGAGDERSAGTGRPTGAGDAGSGVPAVVLAATDPANPYGAALAWPAGVADTATRTVGGRGHRPGRTAGAVVVLVGGALVLYLERGGRTVLSFSGDERLLAIAAGVLVTTAGDGRLGRLTLQRLDGAELLDRATLATPGARALVAAGFAVTPRGLRLSAR